MFDVTQPKLAWTLILVSGALEVAFATSVQLSQGFTRLLPAVAALVFGGLSVYLMSLSLSVIPIGTAYAVWGGIGAGFKKSLRLPGPWMIGFAASIEGNFVFSCGLYSNVLMSSSRICRLPWACSGSSPPDRRPRRSPSCSSSSAYSLPATRSSTGSTSASASSSRRTACGGSG